MGGGSFLKEFAYCLDRSIPVNRWRPSHPTLAHGYRQCRATSQHEMHADGTVDIQTSAVPEMCNTWMSMIGGLGDGVDQTQPVTSQLVVNRSCALKNYSGHHEYNQGDNDTTHGDIIKKQKQQAPWIKPTKRLQRPLAQRVVKTQILARAHWTTASIPF